MPKVAPLNKYAARKDAVRRAINVGMARKDLKPDDLDKRQVINKNTLFLRKREADTMRLGELWRIDDIVKFTDEEILQMFGRGGTR